MYMYYYSILSVFPLFLLPLAVGPAIFLTYPIGVYIVQRARTQTQCAHLLGITKNVLRNVGLFGHFGLGIRKARTHLSSLARKIPSKNLEQPCATNHRLEKIQLVRLAHLGRFHIII